MIQQYLNHDMTVELDTTNPNEVVVRQVYTDKETGKRDEHTKLFFSQDDLSKINQVLGYENKVEVSFFNGIQKIMYLFDGNILFIFSRSAFIMTDKDDVAKFKDLCFTANKKARGIE